MDDGEVAKLRGQLDEFVGDVFASLTGVPQLVGISGRFGVWDPHDSGVLAR